MSTAFARLFALSVFLACALGAAGSAEARLRICNQTDSAVSIAAGYLDGTNGWTAQGWWTVAPGDCPTLVEGRLSGSYVYLLVDGGLLKPRASQQGGWFCTDDTGFLTRNSDYSDATRQLLCESAGLTTEQFREIPLKGTSLTFNLK